VSPGLIAAIAAVLADSIITIAVGWKLTHTARTEIAKGVEDVIEHAPELIARAMTTRGESDAGSNES
jgi:hypothetical protein